VRAGGSLTRSHARFLGFKLFTMLLPSLHADDVPVLFSQQFMRCMVNSLTNKDTMLHTSASVCLSNVRVEPALVCWCCVCIRSYS
jgi:DNA polymerase phi